MHLLVTAGGTYVPIDGARGIGNRFTGRTGAAIAGEAHRRGHVITLLTSHPEKGVGFEESVRTDGERWRVLPYKTFDDLHRLMAERVPRVDAVVHSAAVSDYLTAGVYASAEGTRFEAESGLWIGDPPRMQDRSAEKIKSDEPELWVRLKRAPKLVDLIRGAWGFRGVLVKFKLEAGIDDAGLLRIAERSRQDSRADLMVANTLEGAEEWAFVGPSPTGYLRIQRGELPVVLMGMVEHCHQERGHG